MSQCNTDRFDGLRILVAETDAARSAAYRLRHDAYVAEGAIDPIPGGEFIDQYDSLRTTILFLATDRQVPCGSLRFSLCPAGGGDAPSAAEFVAFADHTSRLIADGRPIAVGSRFAIDDLCERRNEVALLLMAAQGLAAYACSAKYGLATVRGSHTSFYRRLMCMTPIAPPRRMPGLKYDYELVAADLDASSARWHAAYPKSAMTHFSDAHPHWTADVRARLAGVLSGG